jgi:deoxyribodipyrimidine photolyase
MSNSKDPVIYWLREDFRIHDNLALTEAAKDNKNLILVYFSNYLDKQQDQLRKFGLTIVF